jgi:hypothetical protein
MSRHAKPAQSSLFLGDLSALRQRIEGWRAQVMPSLRSIDLGGRIVLLEGLTDADTPAVAEALRAVDARIKTTARACARARARLALEAVPHG